VDHREVHRAGDDLAGRDVPASGGVRDDLLGQRHRHGDIIAISVTLPSMP
jgi:hypothetical protein